MIPSFVSLLGICFVFFFSGSFAMPAPIGLRESALQIRQQASAPITFQQNQTTTDSNGNTVIELCTIAFQQTQDSTGQNVVVMTTSCVPSSGAASGSSASSDSVGATSTASSSNASVTSLAPPATASASSTTVTDTASSSTSAAPTSSSAPGPTTSTAPSASSSSSSVQSTSSTPGTQAAASNNPPAVPGQKIAILPIGLGVFAGLAGIALIVVAAVTWERTRYRKAFRARKLAEAAAPMGYGGTAQRV